MKTNFKKPLITILILGILTLTGVLTFNLSNSVASGNTTLATTNDLAKAGFTQIKVGSPAAGGHFTGPNLYFTVSDKVSSQSSEAPNVVMVSNLSLPYSPATSALFKYGSDNFDLSISGGSGKEATLADGRTAINFIKGNNYVVIIGPNQSKIETLASELAKKGQ